MIIYNNIIKNYTFILLAIVSSFFISVNAIWTSQQAPLDGNGYEQCRASCNCGQSTCYSTGPWHGSCGNGFVGYIISGSPRWVTGVCGNYTYWTQCSVSCCTPTNGGWSGWNWSGWSTCSSSCTQTRTAVRYCNSPSPSCGGANCSGSNTTSETQSCTGGACCTVVAPSAPTLLTPANNTVLTRATNVNLTWSAPSSWGNDCNNAANYYGLTTVFNGVSATLNTASTTNNYSLGTCNSTLTWRVAANNGGAWGPSSSTFTLTNTGFTGPTISNFSATSNVVSAGTPITFSSTSTDTDPSADIVWVRYIVRNSANVTVADSLNMTTPCNGTSSTCNTSYTWTPPANTPQGNYSVRVLSADQCGYTSAIYVHNFSVAPVYNLQVNVDRLGLVIPDGSGTIDFGSVCSSSNITGDFSNVSVTYYAGGISRATGVSNASGVVTFSNIPQADVTAGITLTATVNGVESCQSYDFYCYGENPNGMGDQTGHRVSFTDSSGNPLAAGATEIVTIGLGEEKKDSWETVFDGDIYARNANIGVSCSDATAGGGFETTTIVESTIGGFFRTSGALNSNAQKDIYTGNDSGYAKDLDGLEGNSGNPVTSLDAWFNNYEFPNMTSSTAPTLTASNFSSISGNRIYKSGSLSLSGSYNLGSSNAVSIVYVDGDLTFTGNLTSTNGLVIFIVNGNVIVNSSVGISNYTTAGTFTPTTGANITAGILGLNDVTFASNGTGDNPVILNGFIMNRGDMYFNRDLLANNDRYPAHVIKYPTRILSMLSDLEESLSTGLATYDVQWIYDEN